MSRHKLIRLSMIVGLAICFTQSTRTTDSNSPGNSSPAITGASAGLPLDKIKLPKGFSISVFAEVDNARSLAISPSGVLFVGNRNEDKVYALKDTDGDGKAD